MAGRRSKTPAPATTVSGREEQLVDLAVAMAEEQLRKGTASAQVLTHFLRLGTVRAQLEAEKIKHENLLLQAKTDAILSSQRMEELYSKALSAMKKYQGVDDSEEDF